MKACIANEMVYQADEYPILFQPQPWTLSKFPPGITMKSNKKIKVSVSGFQNSERSGIKHMLETIGATYTDNMGNKNTHLICKEAKGPKYHKAIEWGLHVVTVDWLYHIIQYGYYGKDTRSTSEDDVTGRSGCENKFAMTFSPRRVQPMNKGMRVNGDPNGPNNTIVSPSAGFESKQKRSKMN